MLEDSLPEIEPAGFQFDVSDVGSPEEVDLALGRPFPTPADYHSLTAETCQCMAAAASTQGNSMAAERRSLQASASRHHGLSEEDRLRIRALRASELEARNKAAGAALETYYKIAEAEANLSILEASLAEDDDALGKIKRLRGQGVQIPFDDGEFARQRLDLIDKQTDLELPLGQLNAQLVRLLGLETTDAYVRLWPTTDWKVAVEPIDRDAAVQEGLAQRPEMQFLASLPRWVDTKTLSVVRQVVAGADGLLGSQSKFTGLIQLIGARLFGQRKSNERELAVRRRQLADYTRQRRLEITSEIQQAARQVETRLREIAIAKQQTAAWDRRIAELTRQQQIDEASFAEIATARLKAFQAQSDETHRIVGWKIALAKLKEAQGKLVLECQTENSAQDAAAYGVCRQEDAPISEAPLVAERPAAWTPGENHRR
ncbi:MAG TPA: hypothetical protein VMV10_04605 [Pirellulales bacterium]|nr:hypothetical protein [Pirellulales bacterium]